MPPKFYVYHLIDPRDHRPFYVGKGKGSRIEWHEKEAAAGKYSRKCNLIREIWAVGLQVQKTHIAYFDNENDAYEAERLEITFYGVKDGDGLAAKYLKILKEIVTPPFFAKVAEV